jgi:hypothetical protein
MTDLDAIIEAFGLPENPRVTPVPRANVLEWSKASDLDALGALYSYMMNPSYSKRIAPPLSLDDYIEFVQKYLGRCFVEDRETDWADGRYSAGWSLARWLVILAQEGGPGREAIHRLSRWLSEIYKQGDSSVRRAIVDAALEHAFENPDVRRSFESWNSDPELAVAFSEAVAWSNGGGRSPLGEKKRP